MFTDFRSVRPSQAGQRAYRSGLKDIIFRSAVVSAVVRTPSPSKLSYMLTQARYNSSFLSRFSLYCSHERCFCVRERVCSIVGVRVQGTRTTFILEDIGAFLNLYFRFVRSAVSSIVSVYHTRLPNSIPCGTSHTLRFSLGEKRGCFCVHVFLCYIRKKTMWTIPTHTYLL